MREPYEPSLHRERSRYRARNQRPEVGATVKCLCHPPILGYVVKHREREQQSLVRTDYGSGWWPWRDLRVVELD